MCCVLLTTVSYLMRCLFGSGLLFRSRVEKEDGIIGSGGASRQAIENPRQKCTHHKKFDKQQVGQNGYQLVDVLASSFNFVSLSNGPIPSSTAVRHST